jgi:RNA polymerase sigma factor (sigma-70 family)
MTSADLLRECGSRLTNRALWEKFQERFQKLIFLYLLRALNARKLEGELTDSVADLAQDVYLRLVQHDGRILRTFRGSTDYSVMAFLARVSVSVVTDHQRHNTADKRSAGVVVSFEGAREMDEELERETSDLDAKSLASILSWIDVERVLQKDPDQRHARRNLLIFKLHYIDGFNSAEIAAFPGFDLTPSGVNSILSRLRKRLQNER